MLHVPSALVVLSLLDPFTIPVPQGVRRGHQTAIRGGVLASPFERTRARLSRLASRTHLGAVDGPAAARRPRRYEHPRRIAIYTLDGLPEHWIVVSGNVSYRETDLAIPSIGSGTTVSRTYNSTAAGYANPLRYGRCWIYGVRDVSFVGGAVVIHEDGRATVEAL
jgi:hypothetical protein